jgi:hypothetical protein
MRHLFMAAVMTIGAVIATLTAAALLEGRAKANAAHANAVWQAPPPPAGQFPAIKR